MWLKLYYRSEWWQRVILSWRQGCWKVAKLMWKWSCLCLFENTSGPNQSCKCLITQLVIIFYLMVQLVLKPPTHWLSKVQCIKWGRKCNSLSRVQILDRSVHLLARTHSSRRPDGDLWGQNKLFTVLSYWFPPFFLPPLSLIYLWMRNMLSSSQAYFQHLKSFL